MREARSAPVTLSPCGQRALFGLPAFRTLGAAERRDAARLVHEFAAPKGRTIYHAGDDADALYIVASGAVDLLDGPRFVARYGPGEIFGESVLVAGERRLVTASVALDAVLIALSRDALARLMRRHPELHERVSARLAERAKDALRLALAPSNDGPPSEIVVLEGWTRGDHRRAFVVDAAHALEVEIGRPVAIVTVTSKASARGVPVRTDRPDGVIAANASRPAAARRRLAAELGKRREHAALVLVTLDDGATGLESELARLADGALVHIDGRAPAADTARPGRTIFVHDRRDGIGPSLSNNRVVSLPVDDAGRRRELGRLARHLTHRCVGLALGSGAAWGLAHIGVLDVLEREGIPVDVIVGASMGAIVGAHYALGFSPAQLEEISTSVHDIPGIMRILPRLFYLASDFNLMRPGLFAGSRFQRLLEGLGPVKGYSFADLRIPFRAIATDITTGARVELGEGDLSDAMRASFSAPWIFSPFRVGDHVLIDGGMSDPVPAETVRAMGANLVIGVNVVPPVYPHAFSPLGAALRALERVTPTTYANHDRLPNSFDVIVRTLQIMQHELGNVRAGEADLLITPNLGEFWVLEFWRAAEMIQRGRRATEAELPAIRSKLDSLRGRTT